jgi:hypothetical protein
MPRFQIVPRNRSFSSAEIVAAGAGVLDMIDRLECEEAGVMRDGLYSFSACLGDKGQWSLLQREQAEHIPVVF